MEWNKATISRKKANNVITEYLSDYRVCLGENLAMEITLREKLESYASVFARFDEDASGDIDLQELSKVMETIGRTATHLELKAMIKNVDENSDGKLHFREFCNLMLIADGYIVEPIMPGGVARQSSKKMHGKAGGNVKIKKKRQRNRAMKKIKRGDIKLNMAFNAEKSILTVKVFEGRDFAVMDWNGYSDPYCKVYIEQITSGTMSRNKKKTAIKRRNLNPKWDNEEFCFSFPGGKWAPGALAHIVVMDWDRIGRNDFMGAFAMKLDDVANGQANAADGKGLWFKLLERDEGRKIYVKSAEQSGSNSAGHTKGLSKEQYAKTPTSLQQLYPKGSKVQQSSGDQTVTMDMFKLEKVLGKGSFGKVFLARNKKNGKYYALKCLQKIMVMEMNDVEATLAERRILSLGKEHAGQPGSMFLSTCVATFQTQGHLCFVMNLVSGGDLMYMVMEKGALPDNAVRFYVAEISCGLWFLHGRGIIYRDLKLDNVLIDSNGHVKIADFGMCKENCLEPKRTETFCGTPDYIAPEIYKYEPYGFSVDWWALGVVCYEMLSAESPIDGEDEDDLAMNIKHGDIDFDPITSSLGRSLCEGFLTKDPKKRLGCVGGLQRGKVAIQNHNFFKGLDWNKAIKGELQPILLPKQSSNPADTSNFDSEFTSQRPVLTPQDKKQVGELKQTAFRGFDFNSGAW